MREIKIDFDNPGLPQRLDVVENDAQSRFFKAVLYKDGKAYTAPSGATYSIMYRGFGPQNEGWYDTINDGAGKRAACSVSGNVVTCEIARQALRVPGHVSVVLCVTGGNGYMLHGWPIDCNCRNDNYTGGTSVESFFYITQVTNADWTAAINTWEEIKNMIDPTLSLSGKAADAAKVGEAVGQLKEDLVNKIEQANSFNKTLHLGSWIDGKYIDINTGEEKNQNGWSTLKEYIKINPYSTYKVNNDELIFAVMYNENKEYITGKQCVNGEVIHTDGCYYFRLSAYTRTVDSTVLIQTNEIPEHIEYIFKNYFKSINLYDVSKYDMEGHSDYYINDTTGRINIKQGWKYSDFIELKPNTTYYIKNIYCERNYGFYSKKRFDTCVATHDVGTLRIERPEQNLFEGTFTTPNEVLYLVFSAPVSLIKNDGYIGESKNEVEYGENRFNQIEYSRLRKKNVLVLSDSITDNSYTTPGTTPWNKWASFLAEKNEFNLTNDSIHATGFVIDGTNANNTIPERVIKHTSSEVYDYIIIFAGVNDLKGNVSFGDESSNDDTLNGTVANAIRYTLNYLIHTFTSARILAITPLQFYGSFRVFEAGTQEQFNNKLKNVYSHYSVPVLDLYKYGGFRPWDSQFNEEFCLLARNEDGELVHDNLHPNQVWDNNYLAPIIEEFMLRFIR